jgi:hypothetical protein
MGCVLFPIAVVIGLGFALFWAGRAAIRRLLGG